MQFSRSLLLVPVMAWAAQAQTLEVLVGDRSPTGAIIQKYNGTTGAFIGTFADAAAGIGSVRGMAVGPDGHVYVVSAATNEIIKFTWAGVKVGVFVTAGSGGLSVPEGLTFGPDDNLYVSSRGTDSVKRYNGTTGAYMDDFVTFQAGGLRNPRGLVFANDCWPPPCNDGIRDLLVCSGGTNSIKRYSGANGAYMDEFLASGPTTHSGDIGMGTPMDLILDPGPLNAANLYISMDYGSDGKVIKTSSSERQSWWLQYAIGGGSSGMPDVFGMAFGPDTTGDRLPEFWVADGTGNKVKRFSGSGLAPGTFINDIITNAVTAGGIAGPILITCSGLPMPEVYAAENTIGMWGTTHTITVTGKNLDSITSLRLRKTRNNPGAAAGRIDPISFVGGSTMLQATYELTQEVGRYDIIPRGGCGTLNVLRDAFLIYAPELLNPGFEEGYVADATTGSVCDDPALNGNRPKPLHWDLHLNQSPQFTFARDGNLWQPCVPNPDPPPASIVGNLAGEHYASIMVNEGDHPNNFEPETSFFQTMAAPDVSVRELSFFADVAMLSYQGTSSAFIRLRDGDERSPILIDEFEVTNTERPPYNAGLGMASSQNIKVTIPQGYTFQSSPATVTLEFVLRSVNGDRDPVYNVALKGLHVDSVRTRFIKVDCGPTIWADADKDSDVDADDFAAIQRCLMTGAPQSYLPDDCVCFDYVINDEKIDGFDVVEFIKCATGPAVPWTPEAAPLCQPN